MALVAVQRLLVNLMLQCRKKRLLLADAGVDEEEEVEQ